MSLLEKILSRVAVGDGDCLNYRGLNKGYAAIKVKGKTYRVQRLMYETFIGPIAPGLVTDHRCRNRKCVNPAHLEAVTIAENTLRGESFSAKNARKERCIRGHLFTEENTLRRTADGARVCRTCSRYRTQRFRGKVA